MNWEYFFNQQSNYARHGRSQHRIIFTIDGYEHETHSVVLSDDVIEGLILLAKRQVDEERRRQAREDYQQEREKQAWENLRRSFEEVKARMDEARASMNGLHGWDRIVQLAEVTEAEKVTLTKKQIWNRARRKCHPDTGGSHELWLELIKLESYSRS